LWNVSKTYNLQFGMSWENKLLLTILLSVLHAGKIEQPVLYLPNPSELRIARRKSSKSFRVVWVTLHSWHVQNKCVVVFILDFRKYYLTTDLEWWVVYWVVTKEFVGSFPAQYRMCMNTSVCIGSRCLCISCMYLQKSV
jgi:hypothetical protein